MSRKFDTKVQYLKYRVLTEVSRLAFEDRLLENITDIPKEIVPGKTPTMRCCVYKERAILGERIKLAMGGNKSNPNVIEVLDIACDECPTSGYEVSHDCRGCIAHRCKSACPKDAITFESNQKAHIDKTKCIECGKCAKVCPYTAIISRKRPCEKACKVKAISMDEEHVAQIDDGKCIQCGACVYQCPFGAIQDKSFILDVIKLLKESENNTKYKVYAVVAPSIASQFTDVKLGQVITAIKELGFFTVIETALGADIVSNSECQELVEHGFLTSSCCPAFVKYIKQDFPQLKDKISSNLSPMGAIGKYIKSIDPEGKVVFIGPCTAKKQEFQLETVRPYIDDVITFEELQALVDSRNIDTASLEETPLDNASYFGRIFARSGGLTEAVRQGLKEHGLDKEFDYKPISCNGIEECRMALMKAKVGRADFNFIEGMACVGGCIGGAGCPTHEERNKNDIDKYGKEAMEKTIGDALSLIHSVK